MTQNAETEAGEVISLDFHLIARGRKVYIFGLYSRDQRSFVFIKRHPGGGVGQEDKNPLILIETQRFAEA